LASRRWLARLGLACAAGALLLVPAEVALRAVGYAPIYQIYSHPEIFWRKDELLGWSHETNVQGTYVGPRPWPIEYRAPVRINSLGLRGPEIAELPPDGYRVLILGDSMVASFEVPWEKSFPALLESRLNDQFDIPVQVINAGVRGYGTDQSYLYYKRRGAHLAPDLVILIFGGNDFSDLVTLHRMRRTFGKGAFALTPEGQLKRVGFPIPDYPICSEWTLDVEFRPVRVDSARERVMCLVQTQLADHSALFALVSTQLTQNPALLQFLYKLGSPSEGAEASLLSIGGRSKPTLVDQNVRMQINTTILLALLREVRSHGAELLIGMKDPGEPFANANEQGLFSFEMAEARKPEYKFKRDGHWSEQGHQVMARLIAERVAERIRARIARRAIGG